MAAKFEFISTIPEDTDLKLPERKTQGSAGYDFQVSEDIIIYPYAHLMNIMSSAPYHPYTINEMANLTKAFCTRPSLVPTGVKCKLDPGTYLELSVRSSTPLKNWIVMANGVGIIDSDYYNNVSNEGHIYFQVINLSPFPIKLKKGDIIGQGIIKPYLIAENDTSKTIRLGGFGSTNE